MAEVAKPEFVLFARNAVIVAWLLTLAACGPGDGQGLDENGNLLIDAGEEVSDGGGDGGGDIQPGDSGNPEATLAWVQANVFGDICQTCHKGGAVALGLDWDSAASTCANVGRDSFEIPDLKEIERGNPDESYLIWKVEGAGPSSGPNGGKIVADRMPAGGNPALPAQTIQNLRDWIADGTPGCPEPKRGGVQPAATGAVVTDSGRRHPQRSWMQVWETSLRLCSTCHRVRPSNPACAAELECPPRGLVLDADNYYGIFDGRTVVPFDPGASALWARVSSDDPGQRMPPPGYLPLTLYQQDIIREWILDGAPLRANPDY